MGRFDEKLDELFIDFPEPASDAGNVLSTIISGKILHVCGALPFAEGRIQQPGRVGVEVKVDNARIAARIAAVYALALARRELGGTLDRIKRVVKIDSFVACGADFKDHAKVIDGASELMAQIFGTNGKHVRTISGAPSLPRNACVELSVEFEVK